MAKAKCGHCGQGVFELETIETREAKTRVSVLRCAGCNAVAGVADAPSVGAMLQLQDRKIDAIAHQVQRIDAGLRAIVEALNRL
jgi:hypothetical protein